MASKVHRGDHDDHSDSGKHIHFFKIIHTQSVRDVKLRIPTKFVKKYGEGLSNSVFLKLPSGKEWKVDLAKRDGEVWFHKGWKEFAEYHSLAHGHLLVFRYERTSHFQVLIFDKSASEIDYPFNKIEGKKARDDQELEVLDIEVSEDSQPCQKRKDNSSIALQQFKMRRANGGEEVDNTTNPQKGALHHTNRKCKGQLNQLTQEKSSLGLQTERTCVSNVGAYEDAGKFSSKHSSLRVIMKLTHIRKSPMRLPRDFLNGKIKSGVQVATLQVGERSWRINLIYYPKFSSAYFSAGWKAFVRDNALEVKDVCFFEVLNCYDIVMKVSIFKHSSV